MSSKKNQNTNNKLHRNFNHSFICLSVFRKEKKTAVAIWRILLHRQIKRLRFGTIAISSENPAYNICYNIYYQL